MGRPPKFDADQILDAAAALVAEGGPSALSVSGVAERLAAPTGSIYHRFRSRDVLAASLWLRTVERFQHGFHAALHLEDPRAAVRAAATHVLAWSRENVAEAQLLLLYRSGDVIGHGWPPELEQRNKQLRDRVERAVADLCRRLEATTRADRRRVRFAMIDIPYGAVRTPLARGAAPERELDPIVDDAVLAAIDGMTRRRTT